MYDNPDLLGNRGKQKKKEETKRKLFSTLKTIPHCLKAALAFN